MAAAQLPAARLADAAEPGSIADPSVNSPFGIPWADLAVIVAYLAIVVIVGMRAAAAKTEEGFFLAGLILAQ